MITKINIKNKNFLNFIKTIDTDFEESRSTENTPWKFNGLKNFFFKQYIENKKVLGVMAYSKHLNNYHLNFLYIDKDYRSKGIGKIMMDHFLSQKGKKIFTTHVMKKLDRALKFYKTLGFTSYKKSNDTKSFIKKSKRYDPNVHKDKYFLKKEILKIDLNKNYYPMELFNILRSKIHQTNDSAYFIYNRKKIYVTVKITENKW